jgi:hypothetical protein
MPSMKPNRSPAAALEASDLGPGEHAADRLAHYIKMAALYPLASERVQGATGEFVEAVTTATANAALIVKFHEDSIRAGREVIELEGRERLRWLANRARACGVLGIVIQAPGLAESVIVFARWLLENSSSVRKNAPPAPYPAEEARAIQVQTRTFEARFEGGKLDGYSVVSGTKGGVGGGDDQFANTPEWDDDELTRLGLEGEILERLSRILDRLVKTTEDETTEIDLEQRIKNSILRYVVRCLPDDIRTDFDRTATLTEGLLDAVEDHLDNEGLSRREIAALSESEIRSIVFAASRLFFGRNEQRKEMPPEGANTPRRRGHEGDDAISEDLPALVRELRMLPDYRLPNIGVVDTVNRTEELRVFLEYAAADLPSESRALLVDRLAKRLARHDDEDLDAIARAAREIFARRDGGRGADAFLVAFQRAGLAQLLRRAGVLNTDMIVRAYPRWFGIYLDSLVVLDVNERKDLGEALARIGDARIGGKTEREILEADGFLEQERLERMLAIDVPELAPLVRLLLTDFEEDMRPRVHGWLKRVMKTEGAGCLLTYEYDAQMHSAAYLGWMLEIGSNAPMRSPLMRYTARTLIDLVERARTTEARMKMGRLRAIGYLGKFELPEARDCLERVVKAKRFFLFPVEPANARDAARHSLRVLERKKDDQTDV